jgi:CRP-like cAMP-binding protein
LFVKHLEWSPVTSGEGAFAGVRMARGQTLLRAGTLGTVWRVREGAFRLERPVREGQTVVHLALPGDLVGVEALCAAPYACTVTALSDSVVTPEALVGEAGLLATLSAVLLQQQRQSFDMARMRSGTVPMRLAHLLQLLARHAGGTAGDLERKALPSLKDMAQMIDATHETVCRELNRLLPARPRQTPLPKRRAWAGTATPFALAC